MEGKFEQLDQMLPTPNEYRTGSGAPGPKYWQQQADYDIKVELNDDNQSIIDGNHHVHQQLTRRVEVPWLQLDQTCSQKTATHRRLPPAP